MVYVPPRDAAPANGGVYLGRITRVTGTVCYLEVPSLAPGFEYGPAAYPDTYADPTTSGGDPSHTHPARPLTVGDRVACAFLGGRQDDGVVVLIRLA